MSPVEVLEVEGMYEYERPIRREDWYPQQSLEFGVWPFSPVLEITACNKVAYQE